MPAKPFSQVIKDPLYQKATSDTKEAIRSDYFRVVSEEAKIKGLDIKAVKKDFDSLYPPPQPSFFENITNAVKNITAPKQPELATFPRPQLLGKQPKQSSAPIMPPLPQQPVGDIGTQVNALQNILGMAQGTGQKVVNALTSVPQQPPPPQPFTPFTPPPPSGRPPLTPEESAQLFQLSLSSGPGMDRLAENYHPDTRIDAPQYSLLENLINIQQGIGAGTLEGIFPGSKRAVGNLTYPVQQPWQTGPGKTAANIAEVPAAMAANIAAAIFTRGLGNAVWGGLQAEKQSQAAYEEALRQGNWEAAKQIQDASGLAIPSGAVLNALMAKLPAVLKVGGAGLGGRAIRGGTGAGLGYGADVPYEKQSELAQTGQISKDIPKPGLNTAIGAVLGLLTGGRIRTGQLLPPEQSNALTAEPALKLLTGGKSLPSAKEPLQLTGETNRQAIYAKLKKAQIEKDLKEKGEFRLSKEGIKRKLASLKPTPNQEETSIFSQEGIERTLAKLKSEKSLTTPPQTDFNLSQEGIDKAVALLKPKATIGKSAKGELSKAGIEGKLASLLQKKGIKSPISIQPTDESTPSLFSKEGKKAAHEGLKPSPAKDSAKVFKNTFEGIAYVKQILEKTDKEMKAMGYQSENALKKGWMAMNKQAEELQENIDKSRYAPSQNKTVLKIWSNSLPALKVKIRKAGDVYKERVDARKLLLELTTPVKRSSLVIPEKLSTAQKALIEKINPAQKAQLVKKGIIPKTEQIVTPPIKQPPKTESIYHVSGNIETLDTGVLKPGGQVKQGYISSASDNTKLYFSEDKNWDNRLSGEVRFVFDKQKVEKHTKDLVKGPRYIEEKELVTSGNVPLSKDAGLTEVQVMTTSSYDHYAVGGLEQNDPRFDYTLKTSKKIIKELMLEEKENNIERLRQQAQSYSNKYKVPVKLIDDPLIGGEIQIFTPPIKQSSKTEIPAPVEKPVVESVKPTKGSNKTSITPVVKPEGIPVKSEVLVTTTPGKKSYAVTADNTKINTQYRIVPADSLIASHDDLFRENPEYPKELQPRDRTRAASEEQIREIVNKFMPEKLGETISASEGAPIIKPDMAVVSGNGRIIALRRIFADYPEKATQYKQFLKDHAETVGLNPQEIDNINNPVLVRENQSPDIDIVKFVHEANKSSVAAMSSLEQALVDADNIPDSLLAKFKPSEEGDIIAASNKEFNGEFMSKIVSSNERAKYLTADGRLSLDGIDRIRRAITAKAYGRGDGVSVLEKIAEDPDNNVKRLSNALTAVNGKIAKLRMDVKNGVKYDLDISDDIVVAVDKNSRLRAQGIKVGEYLTQEVMPGFSDNVTDFQKEIMQVFDKHAGSATKITAILKEYVENVDILGDPKQLATYNIVVPSKEQLWKQTVKSVESGGQIPLFSPDTQGLMNVVKSVDENQFVEMVRNTPDKKFFEKIAEEVGCGKG